MQTVDSGQYTGALGGSRTVMGKCTEIVRLFSLAPNSAEFSRLLE